MLTKKQNLYETIRGGAPDRLVKQHEAFAFIFETPFQMMTAGKLKPGMLPLKSPWGYTSIWPENSPAAFPLHDEAHLVVKDIAEWEKYIKAPNVVFSDKEWQPCMDALAKLDTSEVIPTAFVFPGIFELCHYLCEIQNTLVGFYTEPEAMHGLIDYLTEWHIQYARELCSHMHPEAILFSDDWGTQTSSFMRPEMFAEFFLEPYKRLYEFYHDSGVNLIVHHSDSYAANLVEYMIDMGIDIWQGCLTTNDIPSLVKKYRGRISFMGGIDNGKVDFADCTDEMIADATNLLCESCGKHFFIPCTASALMTIYPEVYHRVNRQIEIVSSAIFN